MHPQQIERFFRVLARELDQPATVIITGAAAGSLWEHIRPSVDIDFAITPAQQSARAWAGIERAVDRTVRLTGITANYAEDIDRWSPISFLDYRHHTLPYRRFGALRVRLMEPAYWSIGKITRFLESDVQDLIAVLRRRRIPAGRLVRLWARAIRASPRSPALTRCRQQVEGFLQLSGARVWGSDFNAAHAIAQFRRALASPTPRRGRNLREHRARGSGSSHR